MKNKRLLGWIAPLAAIIVMMALAVYAPSVLAQTQDTLGLNEVGQTVNLSGTDPRTIIVRIINATLGIIGIILVLIILYAGFTWMTSGGDAEKIAKAKRTLTNAVIGLVIILSAWGITAFVISTLLSATNGNNGGSGGSGGSGSGGGLGGGGSSQSFQVQSITPTGSVPLRNVEPRIVFSREVDATNADIQVVKTSDQSAVEGEWLLIGSVATFVPTATCPAPNEDRKCLEANTGFTIRVGSGTRSVSGLAITCGGFAPACTADFETGDLVDTQAPSVSLVTPLNGAIFVQGDSVSVSATATDDSGISMAEILLDGSTRGNAVISGTDNGVTTLSGQIDSTILTPGSHTLSVKVFDLDSNFTNSNSITITVRPAYCADGLLNGDETAIDCGGSCGACSGTSCTGNSDCSSGACVNNICVDAPLITGISPLDGRPGTVVSITGRGFGNSPGTVRFTNGVVAQPAQACLASGVATWTSNSILVEVPAGAETGGLDVQHATNNLTDSSIDTNGPVLEPFVVNDVAHPAICQISPDSGFSGDRIEIRGIGFGATAGKVFFADREASTVQTWSDTSIILNTPVYTPANYPVSVVSNNISSNQRAFRIDTRTAASAPKINSITPDRGAIGQYITLQGTDFGNTVGKVTFKRADGATGIADTNFPAACGTGFWSNTAVTVKVPANVSAGIGNEAVAPGPYTVVLERSDAVASSAASFVVESGTPTPGICAIRPASGPVGTPIDVVGENFSNAGQLTFTGTGTARVDATVESGDWTSQTVSSFVPAGSRTGNVSVAVNAVNSNAVPFAVQSCQENAGICGASEQCCASGACSVGGVCAAAVTSAQFAWTVSTGIIPVNPLVIEECSQNKPPSPSPWSNHQGGNNVCVNSDVYLRFNTHLDETSIVGTGSSRTIQLYRCTGSGADACVTKELVDFAPNYPRVGTNGDEGYIQAQVVGGTWIEQSTYQVVLTTGILSSTGIPMAENAECGAGNAYCFTFKTRNEADVCLLGSIDVLPNTAEMSTLNETRDYTVIGYPREDACIVMNWNGLTYTAQWSTSDGRASITNTIDGQTQSLDQVATGLADTGNDPVKVELAIVLGGEDYLDTADLYIRPQPPTIVSYGPGCDSACSNAAVWAEFSVPMNAASVANAFEVRQCTNENCRTFDPVWMPSQLPSATLSAVPGSNDPKLRFAKLDMLDNQGNTLLQRGKFYKVTVRGGTLQGVRSVDGLLLTDLNSPEGYTWTFRVKDSDDTMCGIAAVDVSPMKKIETVVGQRQLFAASTKSAPDSCSQKGQILSNNQSYNWSIDQSGDVSRFINGGNGNAPSTGLVSTSKNRAAGCTDRCIQTGATGVAGKTASCGNRIVETKNAAYCINGRTIFGDNCVILSADAIGGEECDEGSETATCSSQCLWKPSASAQCGNGTIDRGEQCDPGPNGTPGCSADCQVLGANEGGSTCGNGDIADGESCDDGNTRSGDGCSSICTNEGSTAVVALCGNGIQEAGETCEKIGGVWPIAGCDANTCLKTGTQACTSTSIGACCGNGNTDLTAGETCDDGNSVAGDGCSSSCLLEGSSASYINPSFCGDGVTGIGESIMCESAGAGTSPDAIQLAEIVGEANPDASGLMSSVLNATVTQKTGSAVYGLKCGYTTELSCPSGTGLDQSGCCAPRPDIVSATPASGATGVCRNTAFTLKFNTLMDEQSITNHLIITEVHSGTACPAGLEDVTIVQASPQGWFAKIKNWVTAFFVKPAQADVYCAGSVKGTISTTESNGQTTAYLYISSALKANTQYGVLVRGDINLTDNPDGKTGIMSKRGVVMSGSQFWPFTTGASICTISDIRVSDTNVDSPATFTKVNETHRYNAQVVSVQAGSASLLSPVTEYNWEWQPWSSSEEPVFSVAGIAGNQVGGTQADVSSKDKMGSSYISAELRITNDAVTTPSSTNQIIRGALLSTALLCENPWPARNLGAFADVENSDALAHYAPEIANGPTFFNFSTMYCRDGESLDLTADDLPSMNAVHVELSNADRAQGVLRQYLLSFDTASSPELAGDGIGIRVMSNPLHLNIRDWFASKGFSGSPQSATVDGYEALKDGATVYVSAANTNDLANGDVYPNIYIISRNPDASKITQGIFDQLVANFFLNANLQDDVQNACEYAIAEPGHSVSETYRENGARVTCTADWECLQKNTNLRCASFKPKLQRDLKRIADISRMSNNLELTKEQNGTYPTLDSGSFIQGMSTSRWPSWQTVFGDNGATDPVNRFLSCGFCSTSQSACMTDSDCGTGQTCNVPANQTGLEATTCWNTISKRYMCPVLNTSSPQASVSRIYQYRAVDGGRRFELGTELEAADASRYVPSLQTEAKRCTNIDSPCSVDANCTVTSPTGAQVSTGQCLTVGGTWKYSGICQGTEYGQDDVCGNGVIGTNEVCEVGDTRGASCSTASGAAGTKLQVCNDCKGFVDSSNATCVAQSMCGNGRIDRAQCLGGEGLKYGQACTNAGNAAECQSPGDPVGSNITCTELPTLEVCDDGSALNGTYGRCNRTCTGYDSYCGDNKLAPGELCDLGNRNGEYCGPGCNAALTCSQSCQGVAPFCGDNKVDAPYEKCDGNVETTKEGCSPVKYCTVKTPENNFVSCNTNSDCASVGGTCAEYETQNMRVCTSPGLQNQCQFADWSGCKPVGSCGDGNVDQGEECDDGNRSDTDTCTNSCKKNICGDGKINAGVEQCDLGSQNGGACPDGADYGSTCLACTTSCQQVAQSGGYCGNGRVDENSPEQCEAGVAIDPNVSCKALGYDFANRQVSGRDEITCNNTCQYSGCAKCSDAIGDGVIEGQVLDALYRYYPIPGARVTLFSRGLRVKDVIADKDGKYRFENILKNPACSSYKIVVDYYKDNICTGSKPGRPFNGCDGQPWGVLKYTVNNSPYRMPIPGTNPVKFTDYDPAISPDEPFKNIPEPDEGANGGYWPYESNQFSFNSRSEIAKLYLAPKVAQNETYVILDGTETSGNEHLTQYFTNRLYLPPSMGHRDGNDVAYGTRLSASPYKFEPSHPCNWTSQNNQDNIDCFRDFYRGDMNIDLGHWPHAYLACYTPWSQKDKVSPGRYVLPDNASPNDNSNINLHCNYPFGISNSFPRTDAYRRDPSWNTGTGNYQYIVDFTYKTEYNDGTFRLRYPETYAGLLGLRVRVITSQNMYTLNYKDIASKTSCGIGTSTDVHAWHVFSQNEKTGDITIQNKLINSQCRVTGEDSGVTYLNFRDAR
ncbi:MAG: IPT/TIG domain-containing protein [Candidatus Magasanikbacteria bacterium]|nr:IPT/TIG domain-containing protein [Candidatus Magasanikbacteria bacterium]